MQILQLLMVKLLLARHAFTYIEMLFVLSIIAIILYMQMKFLHDSHSVYTRDNQIQQLILKFYYFKSKAIKENQSITMFFKPYNQEISMMDMQNTSYQPILITNGFIHPKTNLKHLTFDKHGNTHQFGSLYIKLQQQLFRIIFNIEKGTIRYEKVKE